MASRLSLAFVSVALLSAGCNFQRLAADEFAPILVETSKRFNRNRVPQAAREAAPALLAQLDGILTASPENETLLLLKAELEASFAFGFIEPGYRRFARDYEERQAAAYKLWADELYASARQAGRAAIEVRAEGLPSRLETAPVPELAALLDEELSAEAEDVLPVFWYAFAWGARINLTIDEGAEAVSEVPRVKALMSWVASRREQTFNGGAHLGLALFELSLGKSIGGKPELGLEHLKAVDRITGGRLLMSKVFYCEYYLPQIQTPDGEASAEDRAAQAQRVWDEYLATLKEVMEADLEAWPEQRLANALAQERAEELYYRADDLLFPPAGAEIPSRDDE